MGFSVPKFILLEDLIGPEIMAIDSIFRVFIRDCELWIELKESDSRSVLQYGNYEQALNAFNDLKRVLIEGREV